MLCALCALCVLLVALPPSLIHPIPFFYLFTNPSATHKYTHTTNTPFSPRPFIDCLLPPRLVCALEPLPSFVIQVCRPHSETISIFSLAIQYLFAPSSVRFVWFGSEVEPSQASQVSPVSIPSISFTRVTVTIESVIQPSAHSARKRDSRRSIRCERRSTSKRTQRNQYFYLFIHPRTRLLMIHSSADLAPR
ncbi:hypothetical protein F5Y09DRAFT_74769 [Xylaria sp. FL1042]|nr:hypothetical protein F5Y09DRAFT_74769 [Xylaria sp. FL1042]